MMQRCPTPSHRCSGRDATAAAARRPAAACCARPRSRSGSRQPAAASSRQQQEQQQAEQQQPPIQQQQQWRVWRGRMPLVGLEPVAAVLQRWPAARSLLQLHTYSLLEGPGDCGVWALDFLPLSPTSPATALALLTAGSVPGEVRVRRLRVAAVQGSEDVRLAGVCGHAQPLAAVRDFNRSFGSQLHLLHNNCAHYTRGLERALLLATSEQQQQQQQQPP